MADTIFRKPKFEIRFITEDSDYHITWDAMIPESDQMTEKVIAINTKNDMGDDSSAFSFVLSGDTQWEKILNANDMVILKMYPNEKIPGWHSRSDKPKNNVLILGLISEVSREGTFDDGSMLYRITGQSLAKAFMQFELRVIQQVTMSLTFGWLDHQPGEDEPLSSMLSGSTVAEAVNVLLDRFLDYMRYNFESKETINNHIRTRIHRNISSWEEDEALVDPTPFTSFEGSFNQLLREVVNKPFCEMFFDVYSDSEGNEKAEFVVRRTPFDKEDWVNLPLLTLESRDVIEETLSQTDLEAYALFNVVPEMEIEQNIAAFHARPQYSQALVDKYGYKMLQVSHPYISIIAGEAGEGQEATPESNSTSDSTGYTKTEEYAERLYNWYSLNPNFFSGTLRVIGHPDYRIGNRLLYKDRINGDEWEFYIEGVSHNFSYTEGFTTTLDVTRGLKLNGSQRVDRFNPPAGPPERFKGGLLGEPSQEELLALQEATNGSKDSTAPGLGNTGNTSEIVRPAEGYVTSPYGMRFHPVDKVNKMHNGVDIAGGGTTIKAMASGVVITARNHSTLGRYIEIDHGNLNGKGKVTTLYAHLKSIHVAVGQKVTAGQQIGVMGTTGKSTGVHLHFEVWVDGKRVDPETWVTW